MPLLSLMLLLKARTSCGQILARAIQWQSNVSRLVCKLRNACTNSVQLDVMHILNRVLVLSRSGLR